MKELIDTKEVCKLLNITEMTLYRYIKDGKLKPKCKIKNKNYYSKSEVLKSPLGQAILCAIDTIKSAPQNGGLDGYLEFLGIPREEYKK